MFVSVLYNFWQCCTTNKDTSRYIEHVFNISNISVPLGLYSTHLIDWSLSVTSEYLACSMQSTLIFTNKQKTLKGKRRVKWAAVLASDDILVYSYKLYFVPPMFM